MDFLVVQYADDTLIIMLACNNQVITMKCILEKYAASTRLQINFHKSSLIPIILSDERATSIAGLLGCNIADMPLTYLGLPLGTTKPSVQDLMPFVDRIERKVSATFLMMTYTGRITVANSLLTSIANFTMCSNSNQPQNPRTCGENPKTLLMEQKIRRWRKMQFISCLGHGLHPKQKWWIGGF
jgi:hypothetical protein